MYNKIDVMEFIISVEIIPADSISRNKKKIGRKCEFVCWMKEKKNFQHLHNIIAFTYEKLYTFLLLQFTSSMSGMNE
jgi:hypothetical protein